MGQATVTTTVLKVTAFCACKGCNNRIHKTVLKNKGVIFIYSFSFFGLICCGLIFGTGYSDNGGAEGDNALPM